MRIKIGLLMCYVGFCLSQTICAEEQKYEAEVMPVTEKITVDGKLSEAAWKKSNPVTGFEGVMGAENIKAQTFIKMLYGKDAIYIGVEFEEPEIDKVKAKGGSVWGDDRIEFPVMVDLESPEYFLFGVNFDGKKEEGCFGSADYDDPIKEFNKPWEAAVSKAKDRWFIEIRIPYKTLSAKPEKGDTWKINFCRQRSPAGMKTTYSSWVKKFGGFHYAGGKIHFK